MEVDRQLEKEQPQPKRTALLLYITTCYTFGSVECLLPVLNNSFCCKSSWWAWMSNVYVALGSEPPRAPMSPARCAAQPSAGCPPETLAPAPSSLFHPSFSS